MKPPQDLIINIPASIVALPDLNLIEKAILNRVHERPGCTNPGLAKLAGLSVRGVESTLARLKERGLVCSQGHGPSRRLSLTFAVEHHAECGASVDMQSHTACGTNQSGNSHTECGAPVNAQSHTMSGVQIDPSATDATKLQTAYVFAQVDCLAKGEFEEARRHARQYYSKLAQIEPRARGLTGRWLQNDENIVFVLETGCRDYRRLPERQRVQLARLALNADPETLIEVRKAIATAEANGVVIDLKRLLTERQE
jgi:Winged helix-turn-helix DNA-binding